jgi:FkbM family methyltransferase
VRTGKIVLITILGCCLLSAGVAVLSLRAGYRASYLPERVKDLVKNFMFRAYGPKTVSGSTLTSVYARLCVQSLFHKGPCQAKMLNFKVAAPCYFSILSGMAEIFVKECYYFKSSKSDPFIVDCGSNIGMSVLYFKMLYPKARMLAFEPSSGCYAYLQKNIALNGFQDSVVAYNKALSNKKGFAALWDPSHGGGDGRASILVSASKNDETLVACDVLSAYITGPVDLLKLDVEGAEHLIIQDLVATNKLRLIKEIVFEYHHHMPTAQDDKLGAFLAALERNGFGYQVRGSNFGIGYQFDPSESQILMFHAYQKK